KMAKGKPKATPKPLIAAVIGQGPFFKALPNTVPKIGPVQEKDTKAKVKAIKKIPNTPPTCEAESALLVNELGNVISKYPKKEMAKTTKTIKKMTFNQTLVAISFSTSGSVLK